MIAGEGGAAAKAALCPPAVSARAPRGTAGLGGACGAPGNSAKAGTAPSGLAAVPGASWSPACQPGHPSPLGTGGSLFCTEVAETKRLQESSWQAPTPAKLVLLFSSSTRSFHFLLPGSHPPSWPLSHSAPSLPSQCRPFPSSATLRRGCWFGGTETWWVPGSSRARLEKTDQPRACKSSVTASAFVGHLAHCGGWTRINV